MILCGAYLQKLDVVLSDSRSHSQLEGVLAYPHCRTYMILSRTAKHDSLSNGSVIKLPPPTASKLGCWRNKQMVRPLLAHSLIKTDEFERLAKSSYYFFSRTNKTHYIIIVNKIYKRKEKIINEKNMCCLFYQTNACKISKIFMMTLAALVGLVECIH